MIFTFLVCPSLVHQGTSDVEGVAGIAINNSFHGELPPMEFQQRLPLKQQSSSALSKVPQSEHGINIIKE
jgi:hypothetical protein